MKSGSSVKRREEVYGWDALSKPPQDRSFSCNAMEAAVTQRLHSRNCPWIAMTCPLHCLTIYVLAPSLSTPAFSLLQKRGRFPPSEMMLPGEMPRRQQQFLSAAARAETLQGVFAVPTGFVWKSNSHEYTHTHIYIWISELHCPFPLTPPLQASGSPAFDYGDLFIVLMKKSSYGNDLWSWMIWSGLNWFRG